MSAYVWFADDMAGYFPLCITKDQALPDEWGWVPIPCFVKMRGLELLYWRIRIALGIRRPVRHV